MTENENSSTLAHWIDDELIIDRDNAKRRDVLDTCSDAKMVGGAQWDSISEILKKHGVLETVLEFLHNRKQRSELAVWIDTELRRDPKAATSQRLVEAVWSAQTSDPVASEQILDVLMEHGVTNAVFDLIHSKYTGQPPESLPPPTDDDKRKGDPRAPGGPLDPEQDLSFRVSKIRKIDIRRDPLYCVEIDGSYELEMRAKQLRSVELFSEIYFQTLDKEPLGMPGGKGKNIVWRELVSRWMRTPEEGGVRQTEEQPDEASEDGLIRHTLREILDELAVGESVEDLDHARVLPHEDGFLVKQVQLLKAVKSRTGIQSITTGQLTTALQHQEIDAEFRRGLRVDGRQVRVWFFMREAREDPPSGGAQPTLRTVDGGAT